MICLISYWGDENDNELLTNAVLHWGRQAFPFCLSIKGMHSCFFWDFAKQKQFAAVKFRGTGSMHRWRSVICPFLAGEVLICAGPFLCVYNVFSVLLNNQCLSTRSSGATLDVLWYTLWCHLNEERLRVCMGPALECHWLSKTLYNVLLLPAYNTTYLGYQYERAHTVCSRSFCKQLYSRL